VAYIWRTKAAISLKRVKIEENLLWMAYRNSPTLYRTVPSRTPYGLRFLEIRDLQLNYPLLSQEHSVPGFKFGGYIYRVSPNKNPLKWSVGVSKFLLYLERVTLRTANFIRTFIGSIGTKAHENCWE